MKALNAHIKSQVKSWDPIIGKGPEEKSFTKKFETILKNKLVLNQKEIELFKKIVDGKKEGVWMHDLFKLYNDVNHMDLCPQLDKYGVSGANIAQIVTSLTPLVFHMFPSSDETYDCLLAASNLEQPQWIFKSNLLREHALVHYCKDLMENIKSLSCKYFNTWTSIESIRAYKSDKFEFSQEFILALLYHYDMVDVEIFRDIHCLLFTTKVEDSWTSIFEKAKDKNVVDSLYKFGLIKGESKMNLDREYQCNRSDMTKFIPYPGKNSHEVVITKVISPLTLSAFLSDQSNAIEKNLTKMSVFYTSDLPMLQMKEEDIQPFTQCVVEHDGKYHRAMIARILSNTDVSLELTDFNWTETFPKSSLMYLHSMFSNIKLQGFTLRLGHITHTIATKEAIIKWLKWKFFREYRMCGIFIEPCKLDGTRRIVSVLMRVRKSETEWGYVHQLMAEEGLVIIDDKSCLFHEKGLC